MKYFTRLGIYKANNVTFNPRTIEAFSYRWWRFVAEIDGVVIFNNYKYSNTTCKHQSKVFKLMNELNIKIDIIGPFPNGISTALSIANAILEAEENLCNEFLANEAKQMQRNENAKLRRLRKKFENNTLSLVTIVEVPNV